MLKKQTELLKSEEQILAPYAMKSSQSAGRVYKESEDEYRLPFQRDRDRIMHCKAFRRLQAKTQVLVSYFGDHYRDRLTHSIEVSQIGRDISRNLGLNEDLTEALCLAHDLGHPPFGHGGEAALDEAMRASGAKDSQNRPLHFEHNEQSRRIIEKLEKIYPYFDGLNPTKEVLDGLLKHNPHEYKTYINFQISPHLEAQVMDLADEIAYTNHDIDDGLRSGLITVKQLSDFALWKNARKEIIKKYGSKILTVNQETISRFNSRIISKMISIMVHDLQQATAKNLTKNKIDSIQKVRSCKHKLVTFSPKMRKDFDTLRAFLIKNFYFNPKVEKQIQKGRNIIKKLFSFYLKNPKKLPLVYRNSIKNGEAIGIVVKDYIAGMTDHFAEEQYALSQM